MTGKRCFWERPSGAVLLTALGTVVGTLIVSGIFWVLGYWQPVLDFASKHGALLLSIVAVVVAFVAIARGRRGEKEVPDTESALATDDLARIYKTLALAVEHYDKQFREATTNNDKLMNHLCQLSAGVYKTDGSRLKFETQLRKSIVRLQPLEELVPSDVAKKLAVRKMIDVLKMKGAVPPPTT